MKKNQSDHPNSHPRPASSINSNKECSQSKGLVPSDWRKPTGIVTMGEESGSLGWIIRWATPGVRKICTSCME